MSAAEAFLTLRTLYEEYQQAQTGTGRIRTEQPHALIMSGQVMHIQAAMIWLLQNVFGTHVGMRMGPPHIQLPLTEQSCRPKNHEVMRLGIQIRLCSCYSILTCIAAPTVFASAVICCRPNTDNTAAAGRTASGITVASPTTACNLDCCCCCQLAEPALA